MSSLIQIRWFCGPVLILVTIYIDKVYCKYTNSLEPSAADCSTFGSVCGGYSSSSCKLFCVHRGHISGSCENFCCTCSRNNNDAIKRHDLNQVKLMSSYDKYYNRGASSTSHVIIGQNICTSPVCIAAANRLKENMDQDVDPCKNFYDFACGNFIKNTKIPNDKSRITMFTKEEENVEYQLRKLLSEPISELEPRTFRLAKKFYKSCMNTDLIERFGVEPLKVALKNIGGWPVIYDENWSSEKFHWTDSAIRSRRFGFLEDSFIKIDVSKDIGDSSKRIIAICKPSLELAPEVLLRGLTDIRVRAYYKLQVDMAVLLGSQRLAAEKDMLDVLEFEQSLANIMSLDERRSNNNPITISQFELRFPSVDWLNYIQSLLPDTVHIDSEEHIVIRSPKYIEGLLNLIADTPYETQSNYAGWRIVASSAVYLNAASRKLYSEYSSVIGKDPLSHSRSSECVDTVLKKMNHAIGSLYIRHYFNDEMKRSVGEIVHNVRKAFIESLSESDWMQESTQETAKEKASEMYPHVGYPQEHLNDEELDKLYQKLQIKENSYFKNILAITRTLKDQEFGSLKMAVNKTDWITHGNNAVANAFYHSLENSIVLPAGILQGHFFGIGKPNYINYGTIGWIIGHEITHGFDFNGHLYDKNGNFRNWWDPVTKSVYETKTQCFVEQYRNYKVGDGQVQINGMSSQGENAADNVGIKQAYRGYLSSVRRNGHENGLPGLEFTPNQLFWISAANNWCGKHRKESLQRLLTIGMHVPEEFRVVGAFSNSAEFASDFKCSKNSPMNPQQKCVLW